jgi:Mn2+/Fe2+ NRAMP family transporter
MPFVLILAGLVLIVAAIRGTHVQLGTLLVNDFTGPNNFVYWVVAIVLIGSLGYIDKLKPISVTFLVLVVLVLFLAKGNPQNLGGGFFEKFTRGLEATN